MISRITGKLVALSADAATVQVGGICYELFIPSGLVETLKPYLDSAEPISLHTIYYIEAGDMKAAHHPRLVGFTDPIDMEFFELFTSVPGLGVRKALKSLVIPISEIARYIEEKNPAGLSRLPGVGPRLGEKIIAAISGKTAKFALAVGSKPLAPARARQGDVAEEALEVLLQLQYNKAEAESMIREALADNPRIKSSEELIAHVFAASQVEA
ncbi:MAG: Holliday junction branch migration protein RuvA [Candidatus Zixiibacteriota bacterium]